MDAVFKSGHEKLEFEERAYACVGEDKTTLSDTPFYWLALLLVLCGTTVLLFVMIKCTRKRMRARSSKAARNAGTDNPEELLP